MISLPTNKIAICLIQANHKSFDTNYQAADSESVQAEYDELVDIPQTAISLTANDQVTALLVMKVLVLIAIDAIVKQIVLPENVVVNERTALDNGTCINH